MPKRRNRVAASRNGKKSEARSAVLKALAKRPASHFVDHRDYEIIIDVIVGIIRRYNLAQVDIDYVDVGLALRKLHSSGMVIVTHGKDADNVHKVTLVAK